MLDSLGQVVAFDEDNIPVLAKVLKDIENQAVGVLYQESTPTAATVPLGKLVIHDDGGGTKRMYVLTGKGNLGYVALT